MIINMNEKKVREAIERLQVEINAKREMIKHNKAFFQKQDNSYLESDIEVYCAAIEALEKQLPKKTIDKSCVKDNDTIYGYVGICPSCNGIVDDSMIVCDCTQVLDWSE